MDSKLEDFRLSKWLDMGFETDAAFGLVEARGVGGFYLSHHDVRRYLDAGATREQIVRIFAPMA